MAHKQAKKEVEIREKARVLDEVAEVEQEYKRQVEEVLASEP